MKPPKVFICYAKQDLTKASDLYDRLVVAGADPWLDKQKLELGDDWEHEIKKAVSEADAFVVCLRPGFDEIGFRQKEVGWALDAWKKIEEIRKIRAETRKLDSFTEAEVEEIFLMVGRYTGLEATVNLDEQCVTLHLAEEISFHFEIDASVKNRLVHGLDDIGLTLKHEEKILVFETRHDSQIV